MPPERFHVKHSATPRFESELNEGLNSLGLGLPEGAVLQCIDFLARVLCANESMNLTGISDPRTAVRLHLLDSLAALPEVEACPPGRMLDLGTGGGFPGVPLAVASGRSTVLMDSVAKKTAAVADILEESRVQDVSVLWGRAEDVAREHKEKFAVVVVRAVAPLSVVVELAAPLLEQGGRLVALKGRISPEEVTSGDRAAEIVGLKRAGRRTIELPGGGEQRVILAYERVKRSSVTLPRRTGLARRKPLA